jgi:hypothetical protein
MGDLILLPVPTSRVREQGGRRDEERHPAELSGLQPGWMASWFRTTTTFMRRGASRRRRWDRDDRHLIAAANALLADRAPTGVPLSFDDAKALRVAIALRNLHPGGGAPTPTYVDDTARRLRALQHAIRDDLPAREIDEPKGGDSDAGTDRQLRVRVGS